MNPLQYIPDNETIQIIVIAMTCLSPFMFTLSVVWFWDGYNKFGSDDDEEA